MYSRCGSNILNIDKSTYLKVSVKHIINVRYISTLRTTTNYVLNHGLIRIYFFPKTLFWHLCIDFSKNYNEKVILTFHITTLVYSIRIFPRKQSDLHKDPNNFFRSSFISSNSNMREILVLHEKINSINRSVPLF